MAGGQPSDAALGEFGEKIADIVEELDIGGRIGARGSADRGLIDADGFGQVIEAFHGAVLADRAVCHVELIGERGREDLRDQRRFSRSRDAGDADEALEGDGNVYVL